MAGYANIADELIDSMTEILLEMWRVSDNEIEECTPGARRAAEETVAKHGIFATEYFIEVYNSVS